MGLGWTAAPDALFRQATPGVAVAMSEALAVGKSDGALEINFDPNHRHRQSVKDRDFIATKDHSHRATRKLGHVQLSFFSRISPEQRSEFFHRQNDRRFQALANERIVNVRDRQLACDVNPIGLLKPNYPLHHEHDNRVQEFSDVWLGNEIASAVEAG